MIWVFNRHCKFSNISINKKRPDWFSREKCFKNLLETTRISKLIVTFDGDKTGHFVEDRIYKVFNSGSGAKNFVDVFNFSLEIVKDPEDIIYFVEDDYLHKSNWEEKLLEGFSLGFDHITLYDHPDKYKLPMYRNLHSKIILGESLHWRTIPSTTDTFAAKKKTLNKYYDIYIKWSSLGLNYSKDHERFLNLWELGSNLISPIPSWSTHCEYDNLACNWSN